MMTNRVKEIWVFIAVMVLFVSISTTLRGQANAGKFGFEITKAKFGLNAGPYRGRTAETNGFFNQGIAGFGQIYFPFQWVVDYRYNFTDSSIVMHEYNNRLFLLRPSALLHIVDNGSYAFGLGVQFSFLISNAFYLEYQLSGIYMEAPVSAGPEFNSGFNLHHLASISKPISRHFSLSFGYVHLSGAGLTSQTTSNQDVLTFGVKWNL